MIETFLTHVQAGDEYMKEIVIFTSGAADRSAGMNDLRQAGAEGKDDPDLCTFRFERPIYAANRCSAGSRMANDERTSAALDRSGEGWVEWLGQELRRREGSPRSRLLALWDVLEEWFAADDFNGSLAARAAAGARRDPTLAAHNAAVRQLLEDLAKAAGAGDPAALAVQLHMLVEGAIVGALVDREPRVARHARELTEIALDADRG
jgi:hypothetical protein